MPTYHTLAQLRAALDPLIRAKGVRTVATAANIDNANLSRWLAGNNASLSMERLEAVTRALGLDLRTLYVTRKGK